MIGVISILRIAILGSAGSGKSTLAKNLGSILNIEVVHIDQLFWKPGWLQSTQEELLTKQEIHLQKQSWIIEGNYSTVWEDRLQAADTVIFLDMNRFLCTYRVLNRWMKYRGRTREDLAEDCPERMTMEFIRYVWQFPEKKRDKIYRTTLQQNDHAQILIFKNRKAIHHFLQHRPFSLNT
ncbi:hypothetical protein [Halobacillus andaensis]|nr:hypothetical protein [Halobacillus andaensis]MBP2003355.1 adenylate kinase family enzyme [Halobacillus andaensis]